METYLIIAIVGMALMAFIGFIVGKMNGGNGENQLTIDNLKKQVDELQERVTLQEESLKQKAEDIMRLTSERDVQIVNATHEAKLVEKTKLEAEEALKRQKMLCDEVLADTKLAHEKQLATIKEGYEQQLSQVKETCDKQLETLREMNKKQVEAQLTLIKEQMKTTSESVLKARQEELSERNKEQVSQIIDPLQKSLKDMQEAFNKNKEQQSETFTRLDETIKINMEKSMALGETADRLTRALTGEVKVQGNFGELKLKQLLEDLELKEGEQFDTQQTLYNQSGKQLKDEDGKGMIPDFILHFPNNRHVVVDAKMCLTDYERYMNCEDGEEKSLYLNAHIQSVKSQVKRLARKDYTRYLPSGYNRLNFAIMYVPIEGALNLALLNDSALWREAYDKGVMILGPQTMYMNLRVLEMMWTQVRQLNNQQSMIDAAYSIVERVQDFTQRFSDVESSMSDTIKKMDKLKIITADKGVSIITAAKKLIKAGAKENKKKKSIDEFSEQIFIETDDTLMIPEVPFVQPQENNQSVSNENIEEE